VNTHDGASSWFGRIPPDGLLDCASRVYLRLRKKQAIITMKRCGAAARLSDGLRAESHLAAATDAAADSEAWPGLRASMALERLGVGVAAAESVTWFAGSESSRLRRRRRRRRSRQ
jgi:hypothetical protein